MPAPIARIALSQYDWDKWVLIEKFYDDQDKFFEKINVMNPFEEVASTSTDTSATTGTSECLTCFEEYPSNVSSNQLFSYRKLQTNLTTFFWSTQ